MKKNIRNLAILMLIIGMSFFENVSAAREEVSGNLSGTSARKISDYITEIDYPAFYTKSANYPIQVAVLDANGNSTGYQDIPVGVTYTFDNGVSGILGGNQIVTYKARNKDFHLSNSFKGIVFY